jgi:hypothetical protein
MHYLFVKKYLYFRGTLVSCRDGRRASDSARDLAVETVADLCRSDLGVAYPAEAAQSRDMLSLVKATGKAGPVECDEGVGWKAAMSREINNRV